MKVVVFGASGRTGLLVVQQALEAGYHVVAFVRDPSRLTIKDTRLSVVEGDVRNGEAVSQTITPEIDGVICVLAPSRGSTSDLLPLAITNIMGAMRQQNVRRLIYMTGAGVAMPEDKPRLVHHVIKFALTMIAGKVLEQSEQAVHLVQNSGLDWTIVRAPMLNDRPHTGRYRVGWVGVNTGTSIGRADAADFIVKQLSNQDHLGQGPVVSN